MRDPIGNNTIPPHTHIHMKQTCKFSPLRPCKFYFLLQPHLIFLFTDSSSHPNAQSSLTFVLSLETHLESIVPRVRLGSKWFRTFARKTCQQQTKKKKKTCQEFQFIFTHQRLPVFLFFTSDNCYKATLL